MRNPRILLYIALLLAIANIVAKIDMPPQLPLVHANYAPSCLASAPVKPLLRTKGIKLYPRNSELI